MFQKYLVQLNERCNNPKEKFLKKSTNIYQKMCRLKNRRVFSNVDQSVTKVSSCKLFMKVASRLSVCIGYLL